MPASNLPAMLLVVAAVVAFVAFPHENRPRLLLGVQRGFDRLCRGWLSLRQQ
jgi:hypothetical protein